MKNPRTIVMLSLIALSVGAADTWARPGPLQSSRIQSARRHADGPKVSGLRRPIHRAKPGKAHRHGLDRAAHPAHPPSHG